MTSETEQPTSSPTAAERKDLYSYRNVKSPNHSGKFVLLGWISQTSNAKEKGPIHNLECCQLCLVVNQFYIGRGNKGKGPLVIVQTKNVEFPDHSVL